MNTCLSALSKSHTLSDSVDVYLLLTLPPLKVLSAVNSFIGTHLMLTYYVSMLFSRMHVIEVKGKSTGPNLRGVYILIESQLVTVMDRLLRLRPASYTKTDYVFGR